MAQRTCPIMTNEANTKPTYSELTSEDSKKASDELFLASTDELKKTFAPDTGKKSNDRD